MLNSGGEKVAGRGSQRGGTVGALTVMEGMMGAVPGGDRGGRCGWEAIQWG